MISEGKEGRGGQHDAHKEVGQTGILPYSGGSGGVATKTKSVGISAQAAGLHQARIASMQPCKCIRLVLTTSQETTAFRYNDEQMMRD